MDYSIAGRVTSIFLSVVALSFIVTGCGGPPTWVEGGSGALHKGEDKAFYGVGAVAGIKHDEPLAWDTAENRARAELAKNFETYSAYLMRDYEIGRAHV